MLKQKNYKPFEIPKTVRFEKNRAGLTKLMISNALADAEIYLYGANLTHFQPKNYPNLSEYYLPRINSDRYEGLKWI